MRKFAAAVTILLLSVPAVARGAGGTVEFVNLSGLLDDRMMAFAIDSIVAAADRGDTEAVVLQIDSPGVIGSRERLDELMALVTDPPLPVVAWVGPAPAVAFGGAARLAMAADLTFAAPGSEMGLAVPAIAGGPTTEPAPPGVPTERVAVADVPGVEVSSETAAPRQVAQLLDGRTVSDRDGPVVLSTLVQVDGGSTVSIVVREPGWWAGFLRLASTPEAAFFLLAVGLTVAAFEFYAIGPGIAAGVAAVTLFLASYGIAVLPVRWWAVAAVPLAVWMLAVAYQRGGVLFLDVVGLALLTVAGFAFTDAAPQFSPGAPGVLLAVASVGFFFLIAMPTVARSRFSTQTIGRDGLVGRVGVAVSEFDPDGVVEVDGARWRATAHREAGISPSDPVRVLSVEGLFLEVGPDEDEPRENQM